MNRRKTLLVVVVLISLLTCGSIPVLPAIPSTDTPVYPITVAPVAPPSSAMNITEYLMQMDEALLLEYLQNLTDFGPRVTGTPSCIQAGTYLYSTFKDMGLDVRYHNWSVGSYAASNIEATLHSTGTGPILIISGHYDTVPDSPGADDDGSGVAAVMAAASILRHANLSHEVRFVCFSGEEVGLLGSECYAKELANDHTPIRAVLNADMIGFTTGSDDHKGKVYYDNASEWIAWFSENTSLRYSSYIDLQIIPSGYWWQSDHQSFYNHGYPGVFYFEFLTNPNYHSENDTISNMNLTYYAHFSRLLLAVLFELATTPLAILSLSDFSAGLGCSATITNIGDLPAENPIIILSCDGGILKLKPKTVTNQGMTTLNPGEQVTINLVACKIGKVTLTIQATADNFSILTSTATAFALGPLLFNFKLL